MHVIIYYLSEHVARKCYHFSFENYSLLIRKDLLEKYTQNLRIIRNSEQILLTIPYNSTFPFTEVSETFCNIFFKFYMTQFPSNSYIISSISNQNHSEIFLISIFHAIKSTLPTFHWSPNSLHLFYRDSWNFFLTLPKNFSESVFVRFSQPPIQKLCNILRNF